MFTNRPSTGSSTLPVADKPTRKGRGWRLSVTVLLSLSVLLTLGYTATSIYMSYVGMQLSLTHRMPIDSTPSSLGLQYKDITFPSRYDHLQLKGWFIPRSCQMVISQLSELSSWCMAMSLTGLITVLES